MKPLSINTHNRPLGQETLFEPLPSPRAQSDSKRSSFSRIEYIPKSSPQPRVITAEYHVEFSDTEPTGYDRGPTGSEAADMLAQISSGRMNSRLNSSV